jgi:hypothetical protein
MALWILDREVRRSRPEWRRAYHAFLGCLPVLVAMLCWSLRDAPSLPGDDPLTARITCHAGADLLAGLSTHLLVALHSLLEMVHYGVWLLAIPLIGLRAAPWQLTDIPMARRSARWRYLLQGLLAVGVTAVLILWAAFLADYPATRDIYFSVALIHVLAEVPFLLRSL